MAQKEQVKQLWHMVYDMLHGPGRPMTGMGASYMMMSHKFDEELLNGIGELGKYSGKELQKAVEEVRAKAAIYQATSLIGAKDLERIEIALDHITEPA
jgi:hypothetical protein